jgi:hypothetical protein
LSAGIAAGGMGDLDRADEVMRAHETGAKEL